MVYLEIDLSQDVYGMLRRICVRYEADAEDEITNGGMIANLIRAKHSNDHKDEYNGYLEDTEEQEKRGMET